MAYIARFQIGPEEKALEERFGKEYRDFKAHVRRWLWRRMPTSCFPVEADRQSLREDLEDARKTLATAVVEEHGS